jgi:hypothetical protein
MFASFVKRTIGAFQVFSPEKCVSQERAHRLSLVHIKEDEGL